MKWTNCVCSRVCRQTPVFLAGSCRAESRMGTIAWISGFLKCIILYWVLGNTARVSYKESVAKIHHLMRLWLREKKN
jgi:hypothetical protein